MKNPLFINKKVWSQFSDEEMADYKEKIFQHYRKNGFPYFSLTTEEQEKVFQKLKEFDVSRIAKGGNVLSQNMLGLNLANFYMPHMWSTKCKGFKSPMDTFEDDKLFRKAIDKRISMGDNMSDAGMRKALCWSQGTHRVSNFRPTVAKYIYETYAGNGAVLDFSCGYGGRLLGALSCDKVKDYWGCEPQQKTIEGLVNITNNFMNGQRIRFGEHGSEENQTQIFAENDFDLAFSSPPYFDTEEYAYDYRQSFVKFPKKYQWEKGFLRPTIQNCYNALKKNGIFAINVANVKTFDDLESATYKYCLDIGLTHVKTYKMALSNLMGKGFKYEPIFIFQKR